MDEILLSLKPRQIIKTYIKQKPSFWCLLLYLIFEYLRPQSMYPVINIFPWTQMIIILWLLVVIFEKKIFLTKNLANVGINTLFGIILLSSALAMSPMDSLNNLKTIIVLILCYYLIIYTITEGRQYFIFVIFYLLINLKLSSFTFINWVARGFEYERYGAVAGMGWLMNPGEFAIQMCIVFAISVYFIIVVWKDLNWLKRVLLLYVPISSFGSVLASGSRGSFLALAMVLWGMWCFSKRRIFVTIALIVVFVCTPLLMSTRDTERFLNMGSQSDSTGANRLERWEKGLGMLKAHPIFGVGYFNWPEADKRMFHGNGALCHNIFIECSSELGLAGLSVFLFIIFMTLKNNKETRIIAMKITKNNGKMFLNLAKALDLSLLAYLVAGFFVTVFYYPYFWINLGMTVALNNVVKIESINATHPHE